jgi:hypothetical protein
MGDPAGTGRIGVSTAASPARCPCRVVPAGSAADPRRGRDRWSPARASFSTRSSHVPNSAGQSTSTLASMASRAYDLQAILLGSGPEAGKIARVDSHWVGAENQARVGSNPGRESGQRIVQLPGCHASQRGLVAEEWARQAQEAPWSAGFGLADLVAGRSLIEVKTVLEPAARFGQWLNQLLGYVLLDWFNALRLEAAGLIERRPDPADRRARRIVATPQGRELLDDLTAACGRPSTRSSAPWKRKRTARRSAPCCGSSPPAPARSTRRPAPARSRSKAALAAR